MIFPPYPKKAAFICSQTLLVKNPSLSKIYPPLEDPVMRGRKWFSAKVDKKKDRGLRGSTVL